MLTRPGSVQLRQIIVAARQWHTGTGKRKQLHVSFFTGIGYLGPAGKDFRSLIISEILLDDQRIDAIFKNKFQHFALFI